MAKNTLQNQTADLVSISQALLVADYLSFRQTANFLGIRASAVSRRVRSLEDLLGVSLFERHHTGVRVTTAGARFLVEAREVMTQLDHAVRTAAVAGRGAVGRLNIGIWSSMSTGFLRELIGVYSEHHPDVAIRILERASSELVSLVRNRHVDVGFIMGTPDSRIATWHDFGPSGCSSCSHSAIRLRARKKLNGEIFAKSISSFGGPSPTHFVSTSPGAWLNEIISRACRSSTWAARR